MDTQAGELSPDEAVRRLSAAGVPTAADDARLLAAHAADSGKDFDDLVARRAGHEPLSHILGVARFRGLRLHVGPGVFVPRPETGCVVDAVHAAIADLRRPVVVDMCAGSGALGLAVAQENPAAQVHLVERAAEAFDWLRRNAAGFGDRVQVHLADAAIALPGLAGAVDVVASNPPYVASHERSLLDREVVEFDPPTALWAGGDGLDVIRIVQRRARCLLRPGGWVVVEHSDRQGRSAPAMLRETGWLDVRDYPDASGSPRYVIARRGTDAGRPGGTRLATAGPGPGGIRQSDTARRRNA